MWVMTRLYSAARYRGLGHSTRISWQSLGNDKASKRRAKFRRRYRGIGVEQLQSKKTANASL
jgi:hypothetical protein